MNLLKKLYYRIPEQVFSTFLLFGVPYIFLRGIFAVAKDMPSTTILLGIIGVGTVFGIIDSVFTIPKK